MKQTPIDTCLITALGRSRRISLNVRLEFFNTSGIFISAIVRLKPRHHPTIIVDKLGNFEFIEHELEKNVLNIGKLDRAVTPSFATNVPSLYKEITHFETDLLPRAITGVTNTSRRQIKDKDVWMYQLMTNTNTNSVIQRLVKASKPSIRRPKSLVTVSDRDYRSVNTYNDIEVSDRPADDTEVSKYVSNVAEMYYCSLKLTNMKYICGKRSCSLNQRSN
jgi:hypothetical protein